MTIYKKIKMDNAESFIYDIIDNAVEFVSKETGICIWLDTYSYEINEFGIDVMGTGIAGSAEYDENNELVVNISVSNGGDRIKLVVWNGRCYYDHGDYRKYENRYEFTWNRYKFHKERWKQYNEDTGCFYTEYRARYNDAGETLSISY